METREGERTGETIPRPEDVLSPFRWYIIPIREKRVTERTGDPREGGSLYGGERDPIERRRPERPSGGMETPSGISVLPYYRITILPIIPRDLSPILSGGERGRIERRRPERPSERMETACEGWRPERVPIPCGSIIRL